MMFGKKQPGKELVAEFRKSLALCEDSIAKEEADTVRAEFNLNHHRNQTVYLKSRRAAFIEALAQAEKQEDERKASEEAAKSAARGRRGDKQRGDGAEGGSGQSTKQARWFSFGATRHRATSSGGGAQAVPAG